MWIADNWKEYKVIDSSSGEKLEKWGEYTIVRPDSQVVWRTPKNKKEWKNISAYCHKNDKEKERWDIFNLPEQWNIKYKDLTFALKPFSSAHTGLFPEQAVNWDWFSEIIKENRKMKVLNLFAYTGGATVAAAKAGAEVVHVDAAKGMVNWAKENARLSGLSDAPIRYFVDDCIKFVEREKRRGHRYDGIIMDPPPRGHGPNGEKWEIEEEIYNLITKCLELMDESSKFFLINTYATKLQPAVLRYILTVSVVRKLGGEVETDEIGLPVADSNLVLPCGASGRWFKRQD